MNSDRSVFKPNIIGIVGSYRRHGTIDTAVSEILEAAAQKGAHTEKVYLQDRHIEFCTNCRHCLQTPGRGECLLNDDMTSLLDRIEAADALVLGAPVNFGDINALTRKFLERTVCYSYWPWNSPTPIRSTAKPKKKAVLVTSSAAPRFIARWLMVPIKTLKELASMLGAKPIGTLWIGMVDPKDSKLSTRNLQRAQQLGADLAKLS